MKAKEIWNIILQKFDRTGSEVDFSVTSFKNESEARETYKRWLAEDREIRDVEENQDGITEYWWEDHDTCEMGRTKLIGSKLY